MILIYLLADLRTDQKKSAIGAIKEINYDVYPRMTNIFIGMSRSGDIRNGTLAEFSPSQCKDIKLLFLSLLEKAAQDVGEKGQLRDSLVEALEHETTLSKAFKWQLVADMFRLALLADYIFFIDCNVPAERQMLYTKLQELKRSSGSPLTSWATNPSNASNRKRRFSLTFLSGATVDLGSILDMGTWSKTQLEELLASENYETTVTTLRDQVTTSVENSVSHWNFNRNDPKQLASAFIAYVLIHVYPIMKTMPFEVAESFGNAADGTWDPVGLPRKE